MSCDALQNSLDRGVNTASSLRSRPGRAGDYRTQASSVHSFVPHLGKDAPDEDPFVLQEAIRFVIFEALVDEENGGGKIFSQMELGADLEAKFPGLRQSLDRIGIERSGLALELSLGSATLDTSDWRKELRQHITEDAKQFVKTELLR